MNRCARKMGNSGWEMGLPSPRRSVHPAASLEPSPAAPTNDIRRSSYLPSSVSHFRREAPSHAQRRRAGFTLIEIVAVLILTTLALVFGAMLLVTSTEIFINSRNAAEDSQKIQVAMNRLVKELTWATAGSVDASVPNSVSWVSNHPDRLGEAQEAKLDGTDLRLGPISVALDSRPPLLDNVASFAVAIPEADAFSITLQSARSSGVTHTTVVHPRYDL